MSAKGWILLQLRRVKQGLALPCTAYVLYIKKLAEVFVRTKIYKPSTCNEALESYFVVNIVKKKLHDLLVILSCMVILNFLECFQKCFRKRLKPIMVTRLFAFMQFPYLFTSKNHIIVIGRRSVRLQWLEFLLCKRRQLPFVNRN